MTHQMKLTKIPFEKITNGQKIIESRLFDEKRQQINVGDSIEFLQNEDLNKKTTRNVVALYRYVTFEGMFSDFPPEYFGGESKETLLREIHQFYSKEDEDRYGVIGIKLS